MKKVMLDDIKTMQEKIEKVKKVLKEKKVRIKYQDIVYKICRLFDIGLYKCTIDVVVEQVRHLKQEKMGKICPQCQYHFPDEPVYQYPPKFGCDHDFFVETHATRADKRRKWRCMKCLKSKYTND